MKYFSVLIASRYTLSRDKSYLLAFISRVSMIGLILAVSVLITVLSVMNGFDKALRDNILALIPHATISGIEPIENWAEMIAVAESVHGVKRAEPYSFLQTIAVQENHAQSMWLYGIDKDFQQADSLLGKLLGEKLSALTSEKTLILGQALAQKLTLQTGDSVRLLLPSHDIKAVPKSDYFTVVGIIYTGTELDQKIALTTRQNIARLAHRPINSVDGLRLYVDDLFASRWIANQVSELLGLYQVRDWSRSQGNLYQAIQTSRNMVILLVFIIIAVAAFNVVSTLVLAVKDKSADIAILRTMGLDSRRILAIFVWQGFIIGAIGVFFGSALGAMLSYYISDIVGVIEILFHTQFLSSAIYPVDHLPSDLRWQDVVVVSVVALLLSVLASLIPAWQASRLAPAAILRYE